MAEGFDAGSIFVSLKAELASFNAGIAQAKTTLDSLATASQEVTVAFTEIDTATVVFQEIEQQAVKTAVATDRLAVGAEQAARFFNALNQEGSRMNLTIKASGDNFSVAAKQIDDTDTKVTRVNNSFGRSANRLIAVQLALITLSQHAGPFRDLFQGIANGVSTATASMQLFGDKVSLLGGGLIGLGVAIESFIFRAWEDSIKATDAGTEQMAASRKRVDELRFALEDAAKSAKVFGSTYAEDLTRTLSINEAAFASNVKRLREISAELLKLNGANPGLFGADKTAQIESLNTERENLNKQQTGIIQTGLFDKQFADVQKILQATKDFNKELENTEIVGQKSLAFGISQPAEIAAKNLGDAKAAFDRILLDQAKIIDDSNKYGLSTEDQQKILAKLPTFAQVQSAADKAKAAQQYNDQVKAVNDLAATFSTSVGDGLRDAILNAKKPMEALAGLGTNLFANMVDQTVKRLETGLTEAFKAISGAAGEGVGLAITGILGAAGAVLSKLGSKGSDSYGGVQSAVTSSQAFRGIVAGPSSVAIATVGDDLSRAVAPVVARLDGIMGVLGRIETNTRSGRGSGLSSNVAAATA